MSMGEGGTHYLKTIPKCGLRIGAVFSCCNSSWILTTPPPPLAIRARIAANMPFESDWSVELISVGFWLRANTRDWCSSMKLR